MLLLMSDVTYHSIVHNLMSTVTANVYVISYQLLINLSISEVCG